MSRLGVLRPLIHDLSWVELGRLVEGTPVLRLHVLEGVFNDLDGLSVGLAELDRDVSDHQRRQAVLLVQNGEKVDLVVFKCAVDGLHRCAAGLLLSLRLIHLIFGSMRLLIQIF